MKKDNETNLLISEINLLVEKRDVSTAQNKIKNILRRNKDNLEIILEAVNWYRKLGNYIGGYKLVEKYNPLIKPNIKTNKKENECVLWAIRFLNLMGSSLYAIKLLDIFKPKTDEQKLICANIYLSNFYFLEANTLYCEIYKNKTNDHFIKEPMNLLSYADSLFNIGNEDEAIKLAAEIAKKTPLLLNKGIALEAKAEYLIQKDKFIEGLECLNKADKLFTGNKLCPDYAMLLKWKAYALCKINNVDKGNNHFLQAEKLLTKSHFRTEALLHLKLLEKGSLAKYYFYPGISEKFKDLIINKFEFLVPQEMLIGKKDADLFIDLLSNDYKIRNKNYLNLNKELLLLANIKISGKLGVEKSKLFTVIWPDTPYDYLQLDSRLAQLCRSIRKNFNISIEQVKSRFVINTKDRKKICVRLGDGGKSTFLKDRLSFKFKEINAYYSDSESLVRQRVKYWLESKLIEKKGTGVQTYYVVL